MRRYTLTVLARDGGGEETTGRIRVTVEDVNDNVPLFQKEAYVGSIRENEPTVQSVARIRVRRVQEQTGAVENRKSGIAARVWAEACCCYRRWS